MSAQFISGARCLKDLCTALGIEGPVRRIELIVEVRDAVRVNIERFVSEDQIKDATTFLSSYYLAERLPLGDPAE